ncbi:hypothetical protein GDO78_013321 [Eleutherodactylus coqui]|nr:hypothetical protein GDO78_013321 [Eleutherodactylus coqui]
MPKMTDQKQDKPAVKPRMIIPEQEKSKEAAQVQEKPNVTVPKLEKPKATSQEQEKSTGTTQEQEKPKMSSQEQEKSEPTAQELEKPITPVQEHDQLTMTVFEQEKHTETSLRPKPPKFKKSTQEPQRNPVQNFIDLTPPVEKEPETAQGWLELFEKEWGLRGRAIILPDNANWKEIYKKKPFGRNLLKSPNPEGLSTTQPPPKEEFDPPPEKKPLETLGDFSGWQISTEDIPVDRSNVPPGVVVCYLPEYSWCVKEQLLDLSSEGLWPELLDSYQPDIYVLDWYEDSKLHKYVYELHVKLLADDKKTILAQLDLTPENAMSGEPKGWNMVSHIFKSYGSGLRYIHFLHKSKDLSVLGFHRTRVADSTLFAQLRG